MPELVPFSAVRYRLNSARLSHAVCPPYDIIPKDQARRLRRFPDNAIHLELPAGDEGRYRRARRFWERSLKSGLLARDAAPSFYIVEHRFSAGGRERSRWGLFAELRFLAGKSRVIPHERTFKKYRRDRELLLDALKANTSPIFLLFPDPGGRARRALSAAAKAAPLAAAKAPWGDSLRLWAAADAPRWRRLLRGKPLLIADGHHRFRVSQEHARASGREEGCLVYLAPDEAPGLLLPTHRVVRPARPLLDKLDRLANLEPAASPRELEDALRRARGARAGVIHEGRLWLARPKRRFLGLPVEWVARGLGVDPLRDEVWYTHDAAEAATHSKETGGVALLLPAPDLKGVRAAVRRAGLLPEKTTYFYPKVPTGLVFRELPS